MKSRIINVMAVALILLFLCVAPARARWLENGTPVTTAVGLQQEPTMVPDGTGGVIIVWSDQRGSDFDIYAQRVNAYGDTMWEPDGVPICTAGGHQTLVEVVADAAHGAIITWTDSRNGSDDIYAQRIVSTGAVVWSTDGLAVCSFSGNQYGPKITPGVSCGAVVAWIDERNGNHDIYAQGITASGSMLWTTNGAVICADSADQYDPALCSDLMGGALITWVDERGIDPDIYAQRVCGGCDSALWEEDGVAVCTASGSPEGQRGPCIVSDGTKGAIVTWEDYRSGVPLIYAQRIDSDANVLWAVDGVRINTANSHQTRHVCVTDCSGGAVIAWRERFRNGLDSLDYDIYAQRISLNGGMRWAPEGVPICTAPDRQGCPQIASDNMGGAVIAWGDTSSSSENWDIYAQKIDSTGCIEWAANGTAVCTTTAWNRCDDCFTAVTAVCDGGSVFAWSDKRGGDGDIYAAKLTGEGETPVTGVPEIGVGFCLAQNFPNPFNPSTAIPFTLNKTSYVSLRIYDVSGRLVRTIAERRFDTGCHTETWDGRDNTGRRVSSGVYYCKLAAGAFSETRKMVLLQ
jgi:hypothetical protein